MFRETCGYENRRYIGVLQKSQQSAVLKRSPEKKGETKIGKNRRTPAFSQMGWVWGGWRWNGGPDSRGSSRRHLFSINDDMIPQIRDSHFTQDPRGVLITVKSCNRIPLG